jgi:hypothetical protein
VNTLKKTIERLAVHRRLSVQRSLARDGLRIVGNGDIPHFPSDLRALGGDDRATLSEPAATIQARPALAKKIVENCESAQPRPGSG